MKVTKYFSTNMFKIIKSGMMLTTASILYGTSFFNVQPINAQSNDWLYTGNGHMGKDPIVAGTWNNKKIAVCRSSTANGSLSGHLAEGTTGCFIAWGNSSYYTTNYSVLQGNYKYKWVDRNKINNNRLLIYVGRNNTSRKGNYVCRSNNGLPGRLEGGISGICYTSWGNGNTGHSRFDVLVRK